MSQDGKQKRPDQSFGHRSHKYCRIKLELAAKVNTCKLSANRHPFLMKNASGKISVVLLMIQQTLRVEICVEEDPLCKTNDACTILRAPGPQPSMCRASCLARCVVVSNEPIRSDLWTNPRGLTVKAKPFTFQAYD
ncbi:hypothetical protein CEXT_616091 [Caerostris extrusa]|uniref:Uncharacterized protein n=1 Tax=Caerostris extrusa TaxID=172846 RepID=A0AAV4X265_CAEEX|nr:hypothetical protein CEXT_616091 [Caerostris extrusa]